MTGWNPDSALGDTTDSRVSIEPNDVGLTIVDPIQRCRDAIALEPDPAEVGSIDPDRLTAPVTAAVEFEAERLRFNRTAIVYVWDDDWSTLAHFEEDVDRAFEDGDYVLYVAGPIKLYVELSGSMRAVDDGGTTISVEPGTTVRVGARSTHERPAGTVTTTADPEDVMAAVSTFGSALKTTSPERSWPTMRGHPPAVELGESLDVPDGLRPPDTGVRIEVPRSLRHVAVVAPLSYYLGARVVPGSDPRLVTDPGFERPLDGPRGFEATVERTLKQVFFLECLARDEGIYDFPLAERRAVEADLGRDFGRLYDRSPPARLEELLSVPYGAIAEHVPRWGLCTYVAPDPEWVPVLPHLVDDVAVIKTVESTDPAPGPPEDVVEAQADAASAFFRSTAGTGAVVEGDGGATTLPDEPALEQSWAGPGQPVGAGKTVLEAYRNQFDREPEDGPIQVAVVCNDDRMMDEVAPVDNYGMDGAHVDFEFDVDVDRNLSRAGLAERLENRSTDFLHYIGHATSDGLQCRDGYLDVRTLERVDVTSFLLNACDSYEQGIGLVENGAVGGFVTTTELPNEAALEVGRFLARLLNAGFTLRSSLDIVRDDYLLANRYVVVGDGGSTLSEPHSDLQAAYVVERDGNDVGLRFVPYLGQSSGLGSVSHTYLDAVDYQLTGNSISYPGVDRAEMSELFDEGSFPVRVDGKWRWSGEITEEDL